MNLETKEFVSWMPGQPPPPLVHAHEPVKTKFAQRFDSIQDLKIAARFRINVKKRIKNGVPPMEAVELEFCESLEITSRIFMQLGGHDFQYKNAHAWFLYKKKSI